MASSANKLPYSKIERIEAVEQFDAKLLERSDLSPAAVARLVGVSLPTIMRWKALALKELSQQQAQAISKNVGLAINKILNAETAVAQRRHAVFEMMIWLRWPDATKFQTAALALGLTCQYFKKSGVETLAEIVIRDPEALSDFTLKDLGKLAVETSDYPLRFQIDLNDVELDEITSVIAAVRYITGRRGANRRAKRSLSQFHDEEWPSLVQNPTNRATFQAVWTKRAATAPFVTAAATLQHLGLLRTPYSKTFVRDIDALTQDAAALIHFFQLCAGITRTLKSSLDPRALRNIAWVDFRTPS